MRFLFAAVLGCSLLPLVPSIRADDIAQQAQAVLKQHCFSCHGEEGANEGGFNFALNRKRLVRELVVPGDPDESKLFQKVISVDGRAPLMPDGGPPLSEADTETLRQWIAEEAPPFGVEVKPVFVSPEAMLMAILADLEQANERGVAQVGSLWSLPVWLATRGLVRPHPD